MLAGLCSHADGGGVCGQMNTVAEEDQSRPVWPACPAHGWQTGVHRLTSLPNGNRLKEIPGGLTAAGSGSGSGSGSGPPGEYHIEVSSATVCHRAVV